ncbi:hypothetical protein [Actinoplanes xinjiangensis]|uniref:hypothetical protein n=1 Tax=Actinoplanes xinjiangensis TaxID=512350 RepID=UPI003442833C
MTTTQLPLPAELPTPTTTLLGTYPTYAAAPQAVDYLSDQRASAGRIVSGMPAARHAARTTRPEMLAVDESLYYPARHSDDGDTRTPAHDVEHPGALDRHHGVTLAIRR